VDVSILRAVNYRAASMEYSKKETISGTLVIKTMFQRSKSEGQYPMLVSDSGRDYRIHLKGNTLGDAVHLTKFDGQSVSLTGYTDNRRGHHRIVIDPDLTQSLSLQGSVIIESEEDVGSDLSPHATSRESAPGSDV